MEARLATHDSNHSSLIYTIALKQTIAEMIQRNYNGNISRTMRDTERQDNEHFTNKPEKK
jgi:hypothetical protein